MKHMNTKAETELEQVQKQIYDLRVIETYLLKQSVQKTNSLSDLMNKVQKQHYSVTTERVCHGKKTPIDCTFYSDATIRRARAMSDRGVGAKQICEATGIKRTYIHQILSGAARSNA